MLYLARWGMLLQRRACVLCVLKRMAYVLVICAGTHAWGERCSTRRGSTNQAGHARGLTSLLLFARNLLQLLLQGFIPQKLLAEEGGLPLFLLPLKNLGELHDAAVKAGQGAPSGGSVSASVVHSTCSLSITQL